MLPSVLGGSAHEIQAFEPYLPLDCRNLIYLLLRVQTLLELAPAALGSSVFGGLPYTATPVLGNFRVYLSSS